MPDPTKRQITPVLKRAIESVTSKLRQLLKKEGFGLTYFGGSVISMAQIAAGRMYIDGR